MPNRADTTKRPSWGPPVLVLGVTALLIGAVLLMTRHGDRPAPTAEAGGTLVDQERRDPDDLLAVGPVDAPVGLIVFSDYQCPFCARWSAATLPTMLEYAEAGDLRIEWRDANVYGAPSERAARAAYAAAEQGELWAYHEALFPDGQTRSADELSEAALIRTAREVGLDVERFEADLNAPKTVEAIERNEQQSFDVGAHATPTFILAGEPIVGAQPTSVFVKAVEAALDGQTR